MSKITIFQKRIKGCDDSFFYEGIIAKKGKYELIANGEIRVWSLADKMYSENRYDLQVEYPNDKALASAQKKAEKKGVVDFWGNNNWFEILESGNYYDLGSVYYSYSQALKELRKTK